MPEADSKCYCDDMMYRKCIHCQDADDREEERVVCESWNWNYTPRECAVDAKDRGWSSSRLQSAMKAFGFKSDQIAQVAYELEIGE